MPYHNPSNVNTINQQLDQHLRSKNKGIFSSDVLTEEVDDIERIKVLAAEAIEVGYPCYTDSTGLHIAGSDATTQVPATCVAFTAGVQDDYVYLAYNNDVVNVTGASFTTDKIVFLSDTAPYLTTADPDVTVAGRYIQKIGYALSATEMRVELETEIETE